MLATALGLLVGLVLGLTGAGGSVIAVPLLMWGMGWTLPDAAPVALLAVCASATLGTLTALKQHTVRHRAATVMAATSLLTAPFGLQAAASLPIPVLTFLFAVALTVIALRMWRQSMTEPDETFVLRAAIGEASTFKGPLCKIKEDGGLRWTGPCAMAVLGSGAGTGFLAGLLGVGGGFVIVPALRTFTALPIHGAVATSLMTIALTSAGTALLSVASGRPMPWLIALPFVVGALTGMLAGRKIAPRLAGPRLQQGFAVLMVLIAVGMAFKALSAYPAI